jgi:hypothetical protein
MQENKKKSQKKYEVEGIEAVIRAFNGDFENSPKKRKKAKKNK